MLVKYMANNSRCQERTQEWMGKAQEKKRSLKRMLIRRQKKKKAHWFSSSAITHISYLSDIFLFFFFSLDHWCWRWRVEKKKKWTRTVKKKKKSSLKREGEENENDCDRRRNRRQKKKTGASFSHFCWHAFTIHQGPLFFFVPRKGHHRVSEVGAQHVRRATLLTITRLLGTAVKRRKKRWHQFSISANESR